MIPFIAFYLMVLVAVAFWRPITSALKFGLPIFFRRLSRLATDERGFAALTPTVVKKTEFAGDEKVKIFTVTPSSASDTIDLSSYFDTIHAAIPILQGGADAALLAGVQCSFSGTSVTLVTVGQDGAAATDWTGATIRLVVIGTDKGTTA